MPAPRRDRSVPDERAHHGVPKGAMGPRAGAVFRCALACGALLALALPALGRSGADPGVVRIDRVLIAPSREATPPPASSPAWREVRLPYDWQPLGEGAPVWCLAEFTLDRVPDQPLQMLVPQAGYGAEVFLNGRSLAVRPAARRRLGPTRARLRLAADVAAEDRRPNELALRIAVRPEFAGYLTPIWIGEPEALAAPARRWRSRFFAVPDFLAFFALALGAVHWVVYRVERRASGFGSQYAFLVFGRRRPAVARNRLPGLVARRRDRHVLRRCAMHRVAGTRAKARSKPAPSCRSPSSRHSPSAARAGASDHRPRPPYRRSRHLLRALPLSRPLRRRLAHAIPA